MDYSIRVSYIDSMKNEMKKNEMLLTIESMLQELNNLRSEEVLGLDEFFAMRCKMLGLRRMVREEVA